MTESNHTEGTDTTDESGGNELIQSLRQQIKDKDRELKARPDRESLEAEIRTELGRESAIAEQLVALGHPAGMSAILKGQLGEGDVTQETVAEALKGIGYQVEAPDAASESPSEPSQESDLAGVQALSASVRSAASGGDLIDSVSKKTAAAKTPAEITEVMREAGLLVNYT